MSARYGSFDGQVAVVTGAAAGFGLAVATRLAEEGARLVMVDWAADALQEAAAKLSGLPVVADVSQESEVDGYVQAALDAHGRMLVDERPPLIGVTLQAWFFIVERLGHHARAL